MARRTTRKTFMARNRNPEPAPENPPPPSAAPETTAPCGSTAIAGALEAAIRSEIKALQQAKKDDTVLRFALEAHTRTQVLLRQNAENLKR